MCWNSFDSLLGFVKRIDSTIKVDRNLWQYIGCVFSLSLSDASPTFNGQISACIPNLQVMVLFSQMHLIYASPTFNGQVSACIPNLQVQVLLMEDILSFRLNLTNLRVIQMSSIWAMMWWMDINHLHYKVSTILYCIMVLLSDSISCMWFALTWLQQSHLMWEMEVDINHIQCKFTCVSYICYCCLVNYILWPRGARPRPSQFGVWCKRRVSCDSMPRWFLVLSSRKKKIEVRKYVDIIVSPWVYVAINNVVVWRVRFFL